MNQSALHCTIKGYNIAQLAAMELDDLLAFIRTVDDPAATLVVENIGECQRIKLASELHKKGSIYVMDEPTTGLHMSDISHLLAVINRLVDAGNTVVIIEHNQTIFKNADWIIDMGPEGGHKGGRVMFEGTPAQLVQATHSLTSAYLNN